MKILFVSGFLGAGKTSFIVELSKAVGRKFVIIENEFASANVDSERLDKLPDNPFDKIVELSEGCICCSLNINFNDSILTVANALDPDYLVVEPSGVAELSRIVTEVRKICYSQIELLAPITIIDAQNYLESQKHDNRIFQDQLISAGTIVVSKSENWQTDDFANLKEYLNFPNDVYYPNSHYSRWDKQQWLNCLNNKYVEQSNNFGSTKASYQFEGGIVANNQGYNAGRFNVQAESELLDLETINFTACNFKSPVQLLRFLEIISSKLLGDVIRAKGYFAYREDEFLNFDFVEGRYAIIGSDPFPGNKLVFIGRNLNKKMIGYLLEQGDHYNDECD